MADGGFLNLGVSLENLVLLLLAIVLVTFLGNLIHVLIRRFLDERISKKRSKQIARIVEYTFIAAGISIALWLIHFTLESLVVSLGIIGIAIALASQQVVQNAFGGIMISIIKPLELEDWVEVGGAPTTGLARVKDITLWETILRDVDGRIIYLPNSFVMSNKLVNYTKGGFIAVRFNLWFDPNSDIDKIFRIVLHEADVDPNILPDVREEEKSNIKKIMERRGFRLFFPTPGDLSALNPKVNVVDIQKTKIKMEIKFWVREINRREEITSQFLLALRKRFIEEGIQLENS